MKTKIHNINCFDGSHEIKLDIFRMDHVEAIDVYELPAKLYSSGGYRIEAIINGMPAGTRFYSGNLGSAYYGEDSSAAAREFMADARKNGILPPVKL